MLIVVGGMIGGGKSSLAKLIGEKFGTEVFYESVDDNPILPLFYTASEEEIQAKRYPFLLQLHFLDTRFKSIKEALVHDNNVLDRSIYEDWYFAKVNHELGRISDLEFDLYTNLLNNMMEELAGMPKKAPDLMIYLQGSFETFLQRIAGRGREYEVDEALRDYYFTLWKGYDDWIESHYEASDVLYINIDEFDYVNNEDDKKKVLSMIEKKLKEVRGEKVESAYGMIDSVKCVHDESDELVVDYYILDRNIWFTINGDACVSMSRVRAKELAQNILNFLENHV